MPETTAPFRNGNHVVRARRLCVEGFPDNAHWEVFDGQRRTWMSDGAFRQRYEPAGWEAAQMWRAD